jgi:hypothetical protein
MWLRNRRVDDLDITLRRRESGSTCSGMNTEDTKRGGANMDKSREILMTFGQEKNELCSRKRDRQEEEETD